MAVSWVPLASGQGCLVRDWGLFSVPKVSPSSKRTLDPTWPSRLTHCHSQTWTWSTRKSCWNSVFPVHIDSYSLVTKSTNFFFDIFRGRGWDSCLSPTTGDLLAYIRGKPYRWHEPVDTHVLCLIKWDSYQFPWLVNKNWLCAEYRDVIWQMRTLGL